MSIKKNMQTKKGSRKSNVIKQGSILVTAGVLAQLISLITRIPLTNIIGDEGNGFYAAAYGMYMALLLITSYSLPLTISKLINTRMAKGQFKNANRLFKAAIVYALLAGVAAGAVAFFFADFLAGTLMLEPMSAIALKVFAPVLLITALVSVLRGYFQGLGTMMPTAISQVAEQIVISIVSIAAAVYFTGYGTKIAAFLHNESFKASYGVIGMVVGALAGAFIGLLFLLFVLKAYNRNLKKQMNKEAAKINESFGQLSKILLLSMLPVMMGVIVYYAGPVIDQMIYNRIMAAKGLEAVKSYNWGVYIGKYKVLTGIPIALASAMCMTIVPMLHATMGKLDIRTIKDRITSIVHAAMVLTIPFAVGLAVLADPIVSMLFKGEIKLAVNLLQIGSVSLVLFTLGMFTTAILQGIRRTNTPVINAAIALAVHVISLIVMLEKLDLGIQAVVFADILFAAVLYFLNLISIHKYLKHRQELIKTFLMPAGASAVMGIILFILHKVLVSPLGNTAAAIIAIAIGFIVYTVLMVILKGITEKEMILIPGGSLIAKIAKAVHLLP